MKVKPLPRLFLLASTFTISLSLLPPPAVAQNVKPDYARVESLNIRTQGKVFRAFVKPNWSKDGTFWYRNDLPNGKHEFVVIDPVKRTRQTTNVSPATETKAGMAPETAPHASRSGGEDTTLTFVNRTKSEVKIYWLSTEGQRMEYGTLKPEERREQHTYVGHDWLITQMDGTPLVVFEAQQGAMLATIEGKVNPLPAPKLIEIIPVEAKHDRVFVRDYNVFLVNSKTGQEKQLTKDGSAQDAYEGTPLWSPDGKKFVVLKTTPAQEHKVYLVQSSPKDQLQPRLVTLDYPKPGDKIAHPRPHLFDAGTGQDIPINDALFPDPWELTDFVWENDSHRFLFRVMERGFQTCRLISVEGKTGGAKAIIEERAKTFIDWTNKVFQHRLPKSQEVLWMSERDGWNHLYLYDTETGKVKNQVTKGEWVVRGVERVDEEKRQVWIRLSGFFTGQDPYYLHYARVNFDGSHLTLLTQGDGTHTLEYSPDRTLYVDTYSRVDMPPVTELHLTATGEKVMDLERADASVLLATGWRYPEQFVAKARDGKTDIYGVIIRPTNFNLNKKYPVIENIYAGPQGSFVPKAFSTQGGMQALAELGFIVVQMDGMGTNNRSKAFHDVCWHNLADAGFPDRILWMKAAAKLHPEMDLTRVGIYGTSAGGQNALGGLLLHNDFYKAGVSDCGCHDNRMDKMWWNEQWMGYPVGEHYEKQSNVTLASRLTGKLLLMVGEIDTNVDPASTTQVVNALVNANKEFEYFVSPGTGHGVLGTSYGRHRLYEFFVRTLLNPQ